MRKEFGSGTGKVSEELFSHLKTDENGIPSRDVRQRIVDILSANGDPFGTLGVSEDSTAEEIKANFRERARGIHPDIVGDQVGKYGNVVNDINGRLSRAYRELKGHVPPPRTFAQLIHRKIDKEDFDKKTPIEQFGTVLEMIVDLSVVDFMVNFSAGLNDGYDYKERKERDVKAIMLAYMGIPGFQPRDHQLPNIDEVIRVLGEGRVSRPIEDQNTKDFKRFVQEGLGIRLPQRYEVNFLPVIQKDGTVFHDYTSPGIWLYEFMKAQEIPSLEEGTKRFEADGRVKKYGRIFGGIINFFRKPSVGINIEDLLSTYKAVDIPESVETDAKEPTIPQLPSGSMER